MRRFQAKNGETEESKSPVVEAFRSERVRPGQPRVEHGRTAVSGHHKKNACCCDDPIVGVWNGTFDLSPVPTEGGEEAEAPAATNAQFFADGNVSGMGTFAIGEIIVPQIATIMTMWTGTWKKVSKLHYQAIISQTLDVSPTGGLQTYPIVRLKQTRDITMAPDHQSFTDQVTVQIYELDDLAMTNPAPQTLTGTTVWARPF